MSEGAPNQPDSAALRAQQEASREIARQRAAVDGGRARRQFHAAEPYDTDTEFARAVPSDVTRIFLITGRHSEALEDFRGALHPAQRQLVQPVYVALRTLGTPQEVAAALLRTPPAPGHVVVIARGGGDRGDDLWAFNHPTVVSAIIEADVPVVTALGHRGNIFWADRVAAAAFPVPGDLGSAMRRLLARQYYAQKRAASPPRSTSQHHAPTQRPGQPLTPQRPAGPQPLTSSRSMQMSTPASPPAAAPPPKQARPLPVHPSAPQWVSPVQTTAVSRRGRSQTRRVPRPSGGLGVASLVLGIVSAFMFGGFGVLPIVGLILGLCDIGRRPRKAAIAGVLINSFILVGVLVSGLLIIASSTTGAVAQI